MFCSASYNFTHGIDKFVLKLLLTDWEKIVLILQHLYLMLMEP